jgi:hypothetical protein
VGAHPLLEDPVAAAGEGAEGGFLFGGADRAGGEGAQFGEGGVRRAPGADTMGGEYGTGPPLPDQAVNGDRAAERLLPIDEGERVVELGGRRRVEVVHRQMHGRKAVPREGVRLQRRLRQREESADAPLAQPKEILIERGRLPLFGRAAIGAFTTAAAGPWTARERAFNQPVEPLRYPAPSSRWGTNISRPAHA